MASHKKLVRLAVGLTALSLGWHPAETQLFAAETAAARKADSAFLSRAAHAFNDISERAMPAVVSISTVKTITAEEAQFEGLPDELPLDPGMPKGGPGSPPQRSVGVGSGILIREDGLVMTNNHVIENAEKITITLSTDEKPKGGAASSPGSGDARTATVIGTDPKSDLALLRIERKPKDPARYPVLTFGDSAKAKVGDWAIAIGSPFGLSRSVSFGIISYIGRGGMGVLDIEDFIQTDAAINPGSSGGPLLNDRGQIIGVNTAIFSQGGSFTGIGFAIPAQLAQGIVGQLIEHGHVQRGWLGVTAQDLDEDLARHFEVSGKKGALISNVNKESPADDAALRAGDVILSFDGTAVASSSQLKDLVGKTIQRRKVAIKVLRNGNEKTLTALIREEPRPKLPHLQMAAQAAPEAGGPKATPSLDHLGLTVEDIPSEIAEFLGPKVDDGALVVGIRMGSAAFDAGLAPGDIILKANDTKIGTAADLARATRKLKPGQPAVLYVQRGPNEKIFVPLKTGA